MSRFYWETAPTVEVATGSGPLRGLVVDGTQRFLGVPYAAPPVGERRWRPPAPHEGWRLVRDAFTHGNVCAQNNRAFPGFGHSSATEDCLYLNVHAPEGVDATSALPVMVWIPGGGLFSGGSDDYDPGPLVRDGRVVVVTINYRVGVFGFFSHPAINAEDHEIGNYGVMDQQAALRWVRDNIAGFGGDPSNVTVFGESAGGFSVWCHLASPASTGLFHKAIVQSGLVGPTFANPRTEDLVVLGEGLLRDAGVDDGAQTAEALRAVPTTDLLAANLLPDGVFGIGKHEIGQATVDGRIIPEPMADLFGSGRFNRVPIINGSTRNEFAWFQAMLELSTGQPVPAELYEQALGGALLQLPPTLLGRTIPEDRVADVVAAYPHTDHASPSEAMAQAIGDCGFVNLGNRAANRVLRRYVDDVYAYELDAPGLEAPWPEVSFAYGSCHTKDLQYLFPGFRGASGYAATWSEDDAQLAADMVGYWTDFARTGSPNGDEAARATWHAVDPDRDNVMRLAPGGCHEVDDFGASHHAELWDGIGVS